MTALLSIAGLIVAVVLFLNLLQARDKVDRFGEPEPEGALAGGGGADRIQKKNGATRTAASRRICPVCKTGLRQDEYLICAMDEDLGPGTRRQVHIYGCPHCFLTDGVNLARYEQLKDANI